MARADSFFEDSRKRKRSLVSGQARGGDNKSSSRGTASRGRGGGRGRGGLSKGKGRSRRNDDDDDNDARVNGTGNESGLSSDESDEEVVEDFFDSEEEEAAAETPAQKRLRLAKQYLDSLKAGQETDGIDAAQLERDIIAERLQKDVLEVSGRLHLRIADSLNVSSYQSTSTNTRVHRLPLTSAVVTDDCRYLFTAGKDGSIARWDASSLSSQSPLPQSAEGEPEASTSRVQPPKLVKTDFQPKRPAASSSAKAKRRKGVSDGKGKAPIARNQPSQDAETAGHTDEIYTLALSSDGKRLASAGADRKVGVWDISSAEGSGGCKWVSALRGHKDAIVSVKFRLGSSQIYTSSWDRTVKIYDTASLSYIETLFGHQDKIYDLSVLKNEVAVTAGGRDKTLRYWKIKDESQLVFRAGGMSKIRRVIEGGIEDDEEELEGKRSKKPNGVNGQPVPDEKRFVEGSADCTAMIDDQHFLSGGDSGTIALWNTGKKKAIFSVPLAHGLVEHHSETEGTVSNPRWIVSLACLPYSDIFASGSWDGTIRLWKISEDMRSFSALASSTIPAAGFVNSLQLLQLPASRTKSLAMADAGLVNGKKAKVAKDAQEAKKGVMLVAALGQEHKFGRWHRIAEAKNQAIVVTIPEASA